MVGGCWQSDTVAGTYPVVPVSRQGVGWWRCSETKQLAHQHEQSPDDTDAGADERSEAVAFHPYGTNTHVIYSIQMSEMYEIHDRDMRR